jgi:hypothetical protein
MKTLHLPVLVLLTAATVQGASLITGSQYNIDLGSNDGNFSILWEGNTLLGAGDVTSYSYFSRGTNPIRPLLVEQSGANYSIIGVGNPYTPSGAGMQNNIPFTAASGTASFNTGTGNRYFFAFSPVGGNPLQVAYNDNPEINNQGHALNYIGGELSGTGPVSWAGVLGGTSARHYIMTVTSTQNNYLTNIGEELVNRISIDAPGYGFVKTDETFSSSGLLTRWQIFADDDSGRNITPLLYQAGAVPGTFDVVGVGTSRTITSRGFMEFDFGLTNGSNLVTAAGLFYAGWIDSNADGSGALGGTVPFNQFGGGIVSFYPIPAGGPQPGGNLVPIGSDGRSYSMNFLLAVPEPGAVALCLTALGGLLRRRR